LLITISLLSPPGRSFHVFLLSLARVRSFRTHCVKLDVLEEDVSLSFRTELDWTLP
jgi:hypothetical protein